MDWPATLYDSRLRFDFVLRDHVFDDGLHGLLHDDCLQTDGYVLSDVGINMRVETGDARDSGKSGIVK